MNVRGTPGATAVSEVGLIKAKRMRFPGSAFPFLGAYLREMKSTST